MSGQWKEVVRLGFKGERFRDHALDLSALAELSQFQKLVAETAKALWRGRNPNRERLPGHFEQRTRLCLRRIDDGSAVAPLEVYVEEPEEPGLWDREPVEVNEAIELAHGVFEAGEKGAPLPKGLPRHLVAEYAKWGQSLADDEEIELQPPGKPPARVSARCRKALSAFVEEPYEAAVDLCGEVLEADVRHRRFQLWVDGNTSVLASFDEAQEETVTTALKEHRSVRVRVAGRGEHSASGQILRVPQVERLDVVEPSAREYDTSVPPIEDVLAAIAAEVPKEEWDKLPPDLSDQLDHYIYGVPRR